jgi:hypothetical protein
MKSLRSIGLLSVLGLALGGAIALLGTAQERVSPASVEFATIRWDGRDNTHVIRPGAQVEFFGPELKKLAKPERTDSRAYYINWVMNHLAKEGWEFSGISSDDVVMRRAVAR